MGSVCCCGPKNDPKDDEETVPVSTRPHIMGEVVGELGYVYASSEEDEDEGNGRRNELQQWWSWNYCNGKPNALDENLLAN